MSQAKVTAADVRASLGHPVIDADGHLVEYWPELDRYLRAEGVEAGMGAFLATANFDGSPVWETLDPDARLRERAYRSPWWGFPNDARDLATASAPELLYRRLDEFGIDLAVCYPSVGLQLPAQRDDRLRRLGCRAGAVVVASSLSSFRAARCRCIRAFSLPQPIIITAEILFHAMIFEYDRAGYHVVQELAVVADHNQSAIVLD